MAQYAKKIDVGAASVVELKAELFKKTEEFDRQRLAGAAQRRPATAKKPTVWAKPNKGVEERHRRDEEAERASHRTEADAEAALARGVRMYEKLERGEVELTLEQEDELLVDFARKRREREEHDAAAAPASPGAGAVAEPEDPWVEYVDEFGRTRTCRRSELQELAAEAAAGDPRGRSGAGYERASGFVRAGEGGAGDDHAGPSLLSEDMARELKRQRWEDEEREAASKPIEVHYNADEEIRTKGVGFFKFARDEEERQAQLRALNELRQQTDAQRARAAKLREQRQSRLSTRQELARKKLAQAKSNVAAKDVNAFLNDLGKELFGS